jgi:hypothetical protein
MYVTADFGSDWVFLRTPKNQGTVLHKYTEKEKELQNKMEQLENNTNKALTSDLYSLTVHA